jgi:ABC-2 type transport system permease protein
VSRPVSRLGIIGAIVRKDLVEFSRDRLWMILTPLALVMFAVVFWLLPATVEETITVGITPPALAWALEAMGENESGGLRAVGFDSEEELAAAVAGERRVLIGEREYPLAIGLAFAEGFLLRMATGQETAVRVYLDTSVPPEIQGAMTSAVREIAFAVSGAGLPVSELAAEEVVLGTDRAGAQVPLRERMRPMLAFFVLITEALALASLIASEVSSRTVTALLVTPARTADVLAAKGVMGTLLAFSQAFILLLVTRSLDQNVLVLLAAVLLGALLVSGVAMFTGAAGKDFMGTLFYGMLFLIPMMVPAFALLFPGTASAWVQVLPSYGIIQAMVGASVYGQGFAELANYFAVAVLWVVALFTMGWLALQKKVNAL